MERSTITLTVWFQYNSNNLDGRNVLYSNFPKKYIFDKDGSKKWTLRQKGVAIGRVYFVPPIAGERYYLRLLLTIVPSATSFENLRTIEGELCPTFKAACIRLGLVENDHEHELCLEEASGWQTGSQLRHLFVTL